MSGLGIGGGYGAGAGADYLLSLVKQRLAEQEARDQAEQAKQRQALAERELSQRATGDAADRALRERIFTGQESDRKQAQTDRETAARALEDSRQRDDVRGEAEQTLPGSILSADAGARFKKYAPTTVEPYGLDPGGAANTQEDLSGTERLAATGQMRFKGTATQQEKKATLDAQSQPQPVFVIDDKGTMRQVGTAPKGAHISNEPRPLVVKDTTASDNARLDRSYQYNATQLQQLRKPYDDAAMRLGRLHDTLSQGSPQADALIAPELLTVMAGGQGSGLRMNEAEIARIVGGRSVWENLKASVQRWSVDPTTANSITPEQRQQIRSLVSAADARIQKSMAALDQASDDLTNTDDVKSHRQIVANARKSVGAANTGTDTASAAFNEQALTGRPHPGGGVTVMDPNGGSHTFPNQAAADAFKKAAGIR